MDFLSDWVIGPQKQSARIINVIDECSRCALWITAHTSISAAKLISVLDRLVAWRGAPAYIHCDNGPEFIATRLKAWADRHKIELERVGKFYNALKSIRQRHIDIFASSTKDLAFSGVCSWSTFTRRKKFSHAKLLSTTHLFASTTNPFCFLVC